MGEGERKAWWDSPAAPAVFAIVVVAAVTIALMFGSRGPGAGLATTGAGTAAGTGRATTEPPHVAPEPPRPDGSGSARPGARVPTTPAPEPDGGGEAAPMQIGAWLTDLPAQIASEPQEGLGHHGARARERLNMNGQWVLHAVVMHPRAGNPAVVNYELGGRFDRFEARVGLLPAHCTGRGSARFTVRVDGEVRYASEVLGAGQEEPVSVIVTGAHRLTLETDDAGDGNECDRAAWAEPRLMGTTR